MWTFFKIKLLLLYYYLFSLPIFYFFCLITHLKLYFYTTKFLYQKQHWAYNTSSFIYFSFYRFILPELVPGIFGDSTLWYDNIELFLEELTFYQPWYGQLTVNTLLNEPFYWEDEDFDRFFAEGRHYFELDIEQNELLFFKIYCRKKRNK